MRIGIDARKLHDFGIGTYIRNLLRQLAKIDQTTEFVVFCRPQDVPALSSLGGNFRAVAEAAGNYSISEQLRIPLALRREGVTLFHATHYVLPPLVPCRSVVTIHDCIHLMFPQYLPNRFALGYARASMAYATRRATRILTVSESSKRDIIRFFRTSPDKIDVIPNAFDERFSVAPKLVMTVFPFADAFSSRGAAVHNTNSRPVAGQGNARRELRARRRTEGKQEQ